MRQASRPTSVDGQNRENTQSLFPFDFADTMDQTLIPDPLLSSGTGIELDPNDSSALTHGFRASRESEAVEFAAPSQIIKVASHEAWKNHVAKLSEVELRMFVNCGKGDLSGYLAAVDAACKQQGEESRGLKLARLLKPLIETVNMYAPVVRTAIQSDPTPSALVLGGITCIMSISTRFLDWQEKIVTTLSEMGKRLSILREYEISVYRNDAAVQDALVEVYGCMLDFCKETSKLFVDDRGVRRTSVKSFLKSLVKPYDAALGDIVTNFYKNVEILEANATLISRKNDASFRTLHRQYMGLQLQNNETYLGIFSKQQEFIMDASQKQIIEEANFQREEQRRLQEKKRELVIDWIPSASFQSDQDERYLKCLQGTGLWLQGHEVFRSWKMQESSELLWVHGKHGCGKSCLAALTIHALHAEIERDSQYGRETVAIAFVYCNSRDSDKIQPRILLGSILKQLCAQIPMPEIDQTMERSFDQHRSEGPNWSQMEEALRVTLARFTKTFIVVDGLDECYKLGYPQFGKFCRFLSSLVKVEKSVVKVMIFSRPEYLEIKSAFTGYPLLSVDSGANDDDIKRFIMERLAEDDLHLKHSKILMEDIKQILLSKAEGMFLWVDLLVKSLSEQRTAKDIRAKACSLPSGLNEVYELSMGRILAKEESVRDRALSILLWTVNSKRPLSRAEMIEAIAIEPGTKEMDEECKVFSDVGFTADCSDLVVLKEGHYHLLHSSLEDYLLQLPESEALPLRKYRRMQMNSERILGEACLTYLQYERYTKGSVAMVRDLEKVTEENPFFHYAATYWGRHVAALPENELQDLTQSFLLSSRASGLAMAHFLQSDGFTLQQEQEFCTTPLHWLSMFDLTLIIKNFPINELILQTDSCGITPLIYALLKKSKNTCYWLLQKKECLAVFFDDSRVLMSPIIIAAQNDWGGIVEKLIALGYDPESRMKGNGKTALHFAAQGGCTSAMMALLKAVDVNKTDNSGRTALVIAAEGNHQSLILQLLEAGADAKTQDQDGITALHHAASLENVSMARSLLKHGAETDVPAGVDQYFLTPFHTAAQFDSLQVLQLLFDNGATLESESKNKFTPLHSAVFHGSVSCAKRLVELRSRLDGRTSDGRTALHLASTGGNLEILQLLIKARPDMIDWCSENGDVALSFAIRSNKPALAKCLLENGASVSVRNNSGYTSLHFAISEGNQEVFNLILNTMKADGTIRSNFQRPLLHHAIVFDRINFIKDLQGAGVDPEARNQDSDTALHVAALNNSCKSIEKMAGTFSDLDLKPKDKYGNTPLHIAAGNGHLESVKCLLDLQPAISKDLSGDKPLHLAPEAAHLGVVERSNTIGIIEDRNFDGSTALFFAAMNGHIQVVKWLLEQGADPNGLCEFNYSPLLVSIAGGHTDLAELLLGKNANPRIASQDEYTPLHETARIGNQKLVRKLLEAGCNGLHPDNRDLTPFSYGVQSGKVEIVDAFLEKGFDGILISDRSNRTCTHLAAAQGNIAMLQRFVRGGAALKSPDCLERNEITYAATTGQVEMLDYLCNIGMHPSMCKHVFETPLGNAASAGFVNFVSRMIELHVDVEECGSWPFSQTPLQLATWNRRALTTKILLEGGADPTRRDAFGFSALDYATKDPKVWENMGDARKMYHPIEPSSQKKMLYNTLKNVVQALTGMPPQKTPREVYEKLSYQGVLINTLLSLGRYESLMLCGKDLGPVEQASQFNLYMLCSICMRKVRQGRVYICLYCNDCYLCPSCQSDYINNNESPNSCPQKLRILEKLEDDIKSIRQVAEVFMEAGVTQFIGGIESLIEVRKWFEDKLKAYEEWEETHNGLDRFKEFERPGQKFLQLISKARQTQRDFEDEKGNPNDLAHLEDEWREGFKKFRTDQESRWFICSGHEYTEFRLGQIEGEVGDEHVLDANGRLSSDWLLGLLERNEDETDGHIKNEPLVIGMVELATKEKESHEFNEISDSTTEETMEVIERVLSKTCVRSPELFQMRESIISLFSQERCSSKKWPTPPLPFKDMGEDAVKALMAITLAQTIFYGEVNNLTSVEALQKAVQDYSDGSQVGLEKEDE